MAKQLQTIPFADFGSGIDQHSSPDNITDPSFVEDCTNVEVNGTEIRKRKGYQGYYGYLPIRITRVVHSGTTITFHVDSSFDISALTGSPIVVYGQLSSTQSGDFTNLNQVVYYSTFTAASATTLEVTDSGAVSTSYDDTNPQITIWGITKSSTDVVNLSNYSNSSENYLVASTGGNLFAARDRSDISTDYLVPSTTVSITGTVSGTNNIAPLFQNSGDLVTRDNGRIVADNIDGNYAIIDSVEYLGSNQVKYTLSLTNKTGTLAASVINNRDYLTVSNMTYSIFNGEFKIISVNDSENSITVENSAVKVIDFNSTGEQGRGGIFSDSITFTSTPPFLNSDELVSSLFTGKAIPIVTSINSNTVYFTGVFQGVAATGTITGKRTSTIATVADEVNFVVGDMITYNSLTRNLRVTAIDTSDNQLTLDESIEIEHGDNISVIGRWIPLERPELVNENRIKTFDENNYDTQSRIRSTSLQNNIYFTNQEDEIMKYDGESVYRAGLFRWQPQLFITTQEHEGAITPSQTVVSYSAVSSTNNTFTVTTTSGFSIGDYVVEEDSERSFLIIGIDADNKFIRVDDPSDFLSGYSTGELRKVKRLRYYYRCEAIDNNDNVTASANTGVLDSIVNIYSRAVKVSHQLVGFPRFDTYDFENIKIKVFREYPYNSGAFYLVKTVKVNYENADTYYTMIDNLPDENLKTLDEINIQIEDVGNIGTTWEEPLRSKYTSSIDNKLILGNVKDYKSNYYEFSQDSTENYLDIMSVNKDASESFTGDPIVDYIWAAKTNSDISSLFINVYNVTIDTSNNYVELTTLTTHGRAVGQWIYMTFSHNLRSKDCTLSGWHQITSVPTTTTLRFTYNSDNHEIQDYEEITFIAGNVDTTNDEITLSAGEYNKLTEGNAIHFSSGSQPAPLVNTKTYRVNKIGSNKIKIQEYNSSTDTWDVVNLTSAVDGEFKQAFLTDDMYRMNSGSSTNVPFLDIVDYNYEWQTLNETYTGMFYHSYRVASLINSVMNVTDITISGYEDFIPWIIASAGSEIGTGIQIRNPKTASTDIAILPSLLPVTLTTPIQYKLNDKVLKFHQVSASGSTITTDFNVEDGMSLHIMNSGWSINDWFRRFYITNTQADKRTFNISLTKGGSSYTPSGGGTSYAYFGNVDTAENEFNSRVIVSYKNRSEMFNKPYGLSQEDIKNVFDVNPADGQEITGIIPFFGDSFSNFSSKEQILVVFKEYSIYLINLDNRLINKIESQNQGCQAPDSIAYTRNGIIFANNSGIYRLNKDLSINYVGENLERFWRDSINKDSLNTSIAVHDSDDRRYRLAVPINSDTVNSNMLVYNHQKELDRRFRYGAWTKSDNFPVISWTFNNNIVYFGTNTGEVFKFRSANDSTDYRDDTSSISSEIKFRPEHFNSKGLRKIVRNLILTYQLDKSSITSGELLVSLDLDNIFRSCGTVSLELDTISTGFGSTEVKSGKSVKFSLPRKRGEFFQLKFTHDQIDEEFIITSISYVVAGMSHKLITESSESE